MAKLSEGIIARTIWNKYGIGQLAAANIYYWDFESDVLILRNSGYCVEYEIKLSVSDWKAGLRKKKHIWPNGHITRHEFLTSGKGANMFYYVAPDEVLESVDIPDWAGIISVWTNTAANSCGCAVMKKAPFLHKNPAPSGMKEKILTSNYYKYWQHFAVKDINHIMRRTR